MSAILALLLFSPPQTPVLVAQGTGVQVYRCDAGSSSWVLDHPEATLLDDKGQQVGTHGGGPSWQYRDGSMVRGQMVEKSPSQDPGSIPQLVVKATAHGGSGLFAQVETIRRTDTHGGAAPEGGCDAAHAQATVSVPYRATYSFFAK